MPCTSRSIASILKSNPGITFPGALVQVSVGNGANIWGINAQQQVYRYNTSTQTWALIPAVELAEISAAFDGSVWGVNAVEIAYQWNSATQSFNPTLGGVSKAFAGNAMAVWAVNT